MPENGRRIWSVINTLLLVLILMPILLVPERIFIINDTLSILEAVVIVVLISNALFFVVNFIVSFIKIQKVRDCKGPAVFDLLASTFSVTLLMVIKVMSDEVAKEWLRGEASVWSQGEYFILLISLLLIIGVQLIFYLKRK